MSIPGNAETGSFSGRQQVQHQPSINFSGAIPIKKRRFPIIRTPSPPPKEKIPNSEEQESKDKQNSKIPDEEKSSSIVARKTSSSPGNPDVSEKTSDLIAKQEVTPNNIELGQANVDNFAPNPQETMPSVSPVSDLGNKSDILSQEESSDCVKISSLVDARNTYSPGNHDVSKTTSDLIAKQVVTPNNIESGQADVDNFASKPQETNPSVSLSHVSDLGNKSDILSKEESSDCVERSSLNDARNTSSPGNLDVSKTASDFIDKQEVTPKNIELGQANVDNFACKPQETNATASLPVSDLGNESDILSKEESSDCLERSSLIDARNTSSPGNPDVSKTTSELIAKKDFTPNIELGEANVDIFASKPQEAKPIVRLNTVFDLGNKSHILLKGKSSDREFEAPATVNVEQEIFSGQIEGTCGLELSTGSMSVVLSLGPKTPIVPPLESKKIEAICIGSDISDRSLLSLALSDEKLVWPDKSDSIVDDVGSPECTNRSNWDLNTTMDVWEGSTNSDAFSHKLADLGGYGKTDGRHDEKSSLSTAGTIDFSLTKEKHVLDVRRSNFYDASIQLSQQCKTDLGLRLAMPDKELDARKEHVSLSDKLLSTSASPNLSLQHVQISAMNVNRIVKSEPVDETSRCDCNVGSSNSSNIRLLKLSSVKPEFVNNPGRETLMQSSASPNKLADCKSENGTLPQSVARLMQHQESCASSSSSLMLPLKPQTSCNLRSTTFSELTSSRNLLSRFENSFHNKEFHDPNDSMVSKPVTLDEKQSRPCNTLNLSVLDPDKHKLAGVDEDTAELCQHGEAAQYDDEKINISAEISEEKSFESDSKFQGNCAVDNSTEIEENIRCKEDEEYEDGEVREPLQYSIIEGPIDVGKKTVNLEFVACDSQNLQPYDYLGDKDINTSDFDGMNSIEENGEETYNHSNKYANNISCTPYSEDNSFVKVSGKVLEVGFDEKRTISVTPDKLFDLSGNKDVEESTGKEFSSDRPINMNCGIDVELEDGANVKEIWSGENNSTLSKVEESLNGHDAARDSRITQSGKETYSDLDGEKRSRRNRDEIYTGGVSSEFANYRVHDQPVRNSRPSFMHGRGRLSGRFGALRNEWGSDHDFASETSYGPSDYWPVRKRASDAEIQCKDYDIQQDGSALGCNNSNNRKATNDEFRRTSLRRFSPGYRDGPPNRRNQSLHRFPRNMSPNRCNSDKFMRHLSDDIMNPAYNHPPEAMYEEYDGQGQFVRGKRKFSTLQRKGYPRNSSKSPVRSETRSPPGRWSSPHHRSPGSYRMGRMRSPDHACFRDEMVSRRRGSPSYASRYPNNLRDVDSGRDHVHHPRSANPKRRSSPERVSLSSRRTDALDSDGDEYMDGPSKFHDLRGDGRVVERRKFNERPGPGPVRSFRPCYGGGDGENFQFHANDGPRPYRFCPDVDTESVERGNMRERELNGRVKHHQGLAVSRRVRNAEEQHDGNYRPDERVWHDDGFGDGRVRRRRF